jgi:ABC-type methionine transport system permease subunit
LRRKGKSLPGLVVQFVGLLLFLYLITKNLLIAFGAYLLFLVAGIAVGIWLAVRGRKGEAAASTTLDKISCVTNIGLIPVYAIFSLLMMFMAAITGTNYGASSAQEFWAFIFSLVIAATPVYCGIALGMSVSLRKKGRSIAGFFVQFAGFGGIILFLLIDMIPWISITLN